MKTDKADRSLKEKNPGRCIDCPTLPDGATKNEGKLAANVVQEEDGRSARSPGLALKNGEEEAPSGDYSISDDACVDSECADGDSDGGFGD